MGLTPFETVTLGIAVTAYLVSLTWAMAYLAAPRRFTIGLGQTLILGAFGAHTLYLVLHTVRLGGSWILDIKETFLLLTWLITAIYIGLDRALKIPSLAAFFIPINVLLTVGAASLSFQSPDLKVDSTADRLILLTHIVLAFVSYAAFALGLALGLMYLIQERQLKQKYTGAMFRGLPPLEVIERTAQHVVAAGFVILTLSLVVGLVRAQWTGELGPNWFLKNKILFAILTWLSYGALMHLKLTSIVVGRRFIYLTIAAFILVLFNLYGTPTLLGEAHG